MFLYIPLVSLFVNSRYDIFDHTDIKTCGLKTRYMITIATWEKPLENRDYLPISPLNIKEPLFSLPLKWSQNRIHDIMETDKITLNLHSTNPFFSIRQILIDHIDYVICSHEVNLICPGLNVSVLSPNCTSVELIIIYFSVINVHDSVPIRTYKCLAQTKISSGDQCVLVSFWRKEMNGC